MRKRRLALPLVSGVLLLLSLSALLALRLVSGTLNTSVTAAERFRGESETRFAQLACFLPVGKGKSVNDIYAFRQSLDTSFVEQSLTPPENGSLYIDAYCGEAEVTLTGSTAASAKVTAIGVGGEFFYFHPLRLRSGSYLSEDDFMDDLVLLDEETAWRLFGGYDLAGMPITVNGKPFVVGGVVVRENDFASRQAFTQEGGGVFLSWSALDRLLSGEDGSSSVSISCYEIVLPDPLTGYAKGLVEKGFTGGEIVENTGRFGPKNLWTVAKSFGKRSMRLNGVVYPYWENALRLAEDYASLLLVLAVLLALLPAVAALVLLIIYTRRGYRWVKRTVPAKLTALSERSRERRYRKAMEAQAALESRLAPALPAASESLAASEPEDSGEAEDPVQVEEVPLPGDEEAEDGSPAGEAAKLSRPGGGETEIAPRTEDAEESLENTERQAEETEEEDTLAWRM